jgi:hypothetical protein
MEPNVTAVDVNQGAMIAKYGLEMTLVFLVAIGIYTISTLRNLTLIRAWYGSNGFRFIIALVLFWIISAAIVVVPNFADVLGNLGFNFDQGTAGVGLIIAGLLIKNENAPGEPLRMQLVEPPPPDPIPDVDMRDRIAP